MNVKKKTPNPFQFVYNASKSVIQKGNDKTPINLKIGDLVTYYDRNTINPDSGEVCKALCQVIHVAQDFMGYGILFYTLKCYDESFNKMEDPQTLPGQKFMAIVSYIETEKFVPWQPAEDDYDRLIGYEEFCTAMQNHEEQQQK